MYPAAKASEEGEGGGRGRGKGLMGKTPSGVTGVCVKTLMQYLIWCTVCMRAKFKRVDICPAAMA